MGDAHSCYLTLSISVYNSMYTIINLKFLIRDFKIHVCANIRLHVDTLLSTHTHADTKLTSAIMKTSYRESCGFSQHVKDIGSPCMAGCAVKFSRRYALVVTKPGRKIVRACFQ